MAITVHQVTLQVAGAIRALEKLPARERESTPSAIFVGDYNKLLMLAKEAMPEVDDRRWPSDAGTGKTGIGQWGSDVRFTEIHVFLEQLGAILEEGKDYSCAASF